MQIKNSALAYSEIYNYLKNNTSAASPVSVSELTTSCPHASSDQNTYSAVKKYMSQGLVSSLREGRKCVYWWKDGEAVRPSVEKSDHTLDAARYLGFHTFAKPTSPVINKPEIVVSDSQVLITTSKIKITIEF